jgi:hypothetical protein
MLARQVVVLCGGCIPVLGCPTTLSLCRLALKPKNVILPGGWWQFGVGGWFFFTDNNITQGSSSKKENQACRKFSDKFIHNLSLQKYT